MTTSRTIQLEDIRLDVSAYRDFVLIEAEDDIAAGGGHGCLWGASMTAAEAVQLATALLNAAATITDGDNQ